jgi:carbamoyltransferase
MLNLIENVVEDQIIDLILDKKIGAIYQGQSECGPRALGNRSIIFDPRILDGKDLVNIVKKRESFRPFAATVLEEESHNWFDMIGLKSSPFMTYSLDIKEDKKDIVPAIIHVDGTCRIQTINKFQNEEYYNLIKSFYMKTGVPMLLNTSFNLAGEPIVETVEDALRTLHLSKIDYVYFAELKMLVSK